MSLEESVKELARKSRELIMSACQKSVIEFKESKIEALFLSGPGIGIPVPLRLGKRPVPFLYQSFLENIAVALNWYAHAIEQGYIIEKEDRIIFLTLEIILDDKRCIMIELDRKFIKWARAHNLNFSGIEIRLSPEEVKQSKERIDKIIWDKFRELLENPEYFFQQESTEYDPKLERAQQKLNDMRKIITQLFSTPDFISLQQYPYPRFTPEHIREMKRATENFFANHGKIIEALKKNGVDLENCEFE